MQSMNVVGARSVDIWTCYVQEATKRYIVVDVRFIIVAVILIRLIVVIVLKGP